MARSKAPDRDIAFTVPTGNFGDIFAGFVAKQMGLGIDRLVIATNENDVLSRALSTGAYTLSDVEVTITPSMDIQISSNFERLLFEATGRDAQVVRDLMSDLKAKRSYTLPAHVHSTIADLFGAGTANQQQTLETMAQVFERPGYLVDPHTAVAMRVAEQAETGQIPMVTLATAHPAKFPDAVKTATGETVEVPQWAAQRADNPEVLNVLDNDLVAVKKFIMEHSRIGFGRNSAWRDHIRTRIRITSNETAPQLRRPSRHRSRKCGQTACAAFIPFCRLLLRRRRSTAVRL